MKMRLCGYLAQSCGQSVQSVCGRCLKGRQILHILLCDRIQNSLVLMRVCGIGEIVDGFKQRVDLLSCPVLERTVLLHCRDHCLGNAVKHSLIVMVMLVLLQIKNFLIDCLDIINSLVLKLLQLIQLCEKLRCQAVQCSLVVMCMGFLCHRSDLLFNNRLHFCCLGILGHIRSNAVLAMQTCQPFLLSTDIAVIHCDLVGRFSVQSMLGILDAFQKLCIQIGRRRNRRFIVTDKSGVTDIQCNRNGCRPDRCIAFCVIAENAHLTSPDMKLRREIAACAVSSQNNGIHLIALAELHGFMIPFPVTVKCELELHILNLMICENLSLQNLNALVFHKEFPHYSRTSVHSFVSVSYCIYPSRQMTFLSVPST